MKPFSTCPDCGVGPGEVHTEQCKRGGRFIPPGLLRNGADPPPPPLPTLPSPATLRLIAVLAVVAFWLILGSMFGALLLARHIGARDDLGQLLPHLDPTMANQIVRPVRR